MKRARCIALARVHDDLADLHGARLLVDRVWPRGIRRDGLHLDAWIREVAPSTELRKWFGHDPARWDEFQKRYLAELEDNPDAVARSLEWCHKGPIVLLFAAKDRECNQAVVLREHLSALIENEAAP